MARFCVTGGAGFIGSNLADALAARGHEVVVLDDFRTGRHEFIEELLGKPGTELIEGDLLDTDAVRRAVDGADMVFHLQANADVRFGFDRPTVDIEQNVIATSNVLEAMRATGCRRIGFSSTGSVYGEPEIFPTPEHAPIPAQTSLYGTSKMAAEGIISSYVSGFDFVGIPFRFVSILGERYTHGHVFDFYRALKKDPTQLTVLGDGKQNKSYLYVGDCVAGILAATDHHWDDAGSFNVYNLGHDETLVVDDSVATITAKLGLTPEIHHTGGSRGWKGDSPLIHLDTTKIKSLGWAPSLTIQQALHKTLEWFDANPEIVLPQELRA
ncbi:MAG: NAD-dependent epimerase/dehydratase family protein [Patulibacter minatonensis]